MKNKEVKKEKVVRDPINLDITSINQIGEVTIKFSEDLRSINDLPQLNLTMISNKLFFDVEYKSKIEI